MAVRVARHQRLADALAMTPRQAEAYLHFDDGVDLKDEVTAIAVARLAQADKKTLDKHLKDLTPR
jgi:hypothetical protein